MEIVKRTFCSKNREKNMRIQRDYRSYIGIIQRGYRHAVASHASGEKLDDIQASGASPWVAVKIISHSGWTRITLKYLFGNGHPSKLTPPSPNPDHPTMKQQQPNEVNFHEESDECQYLPLVVIRNPFRCKKVTISPYYYVGKYYLFFFALVMRSGNRFSRLGDNNDHPSPHPGISKRWIP